MAIAYVATLGYQLMHYCSIVSRNFLHLLTLAGIAAVPGLLISCGGNGDSNAPQVNGQLIAPESIADSPIGERMLYGLHALVRATDCAGIPAGYVPLGDADVAFLDVDGMLTGTNLTTDACGLFASNVPAGAVQLRASTPDFRDVLADIGAFQQADGQPGQASAIAADANYRIGALQRRDAGELGFTVTDSQSNQAVLGLPQGAFDVAVDGEALPIEALQLALISTANAVTSLVLDASPSMYGASSGNPVFIDPDTNVEFDRMQLATLASHVFLDQKNATDEVSVTAFSGDVEAITGERLEALFEFQTRDGLIAPQPLSVSGFESDATRLRVIIDAYNRQSDLYDPVNGDSRHPDTPADLLIASRYPYRQGTAFYDAALEGIERVAQRSSSQFVLAMTDGEDNRSASARQDVVDVAKDAGVPVYTVGFGDDVDTDVLSSIAEQTGASYFQANDTDIGNAFQSIQTSILFQYEASLPDDSLAKAQSVTLRLVHDGLETERTLALESD